MRIDEQLRCFGLLGFGSGFVWGKANIKSSETLNGEDSHCAKSCPEMKRCLNAHRAKCQIMFPKATKAFDKMMELTGQAVASKHWAKLHPQTPFEPYAVQMIANTEDGLQVAQTGRPKDRGRLTLRYPRGES